MVLHHMGDFDLIFRQNGTSKWGIANIGDDLHFMGDDSTSQKYITIKDNVT